MSGYIPTEPNMLRANLSPQECWVLSKVFPMDFVENHLARNGASEGLSKAVRHAMRTIHGVGRVHDKEGDIDAARARPTLSLAPEPVQEATDILDTAAAAALLNVSDSWVRNLIRSGELPLAPGSTDRKHLVRRSDVLRRLEKKVA